MNNKENEVEFNLDYNKRNESNKERDRIYKKLYLSEIIEEEKPEFSFNNLILAPVGSGKSFLIEKRLIPKDYKGKIIYLTSNTALKDSICPNNNETRESMAKKDKSINFFTSENKKRYGNKPYSVHVMTYHEFGKRILSPNQEFTKNVDLFFCDEIHSLPIFTKYGWNGELLVALRWLFELDKNKTKYFFTATKESLDSLERQMPGYMKNIKEFNYLNHPKIRKYEARSKYYINNIEQLSMHLKAKVDYIKSHGEKGLAFTEKIEDQYKIAEVAESEGFKTIILWSINNEKKEMTEEQLNARKHILETGNIPEPYDLLIINSSMQEGWNLFDEKVEFSILDTTDKTQQVQALGRIRKDIDFIIVKSNEKIKENIFLEECYLNKPLTTEDKKKLSEELSIKNNRGENVKWTSLSKLLKNNNYNIENKTLTLNGVKKRVSIITKKI